MKSQKVHQTYVHILISNVGFIVRVGPISIHKLYRLINTERIQRVVVAKHKFLYFLLHKHPVDIVTRAQTVILVY